MDRLAKLNDKIANDYFTGKDWGALTKDERALVLAFIEKHEHMDYNEFAGAVNRMFLDSPKHGWPQTRHAGKVQGILAGLNKTVVGRYGYEGEKRWIHPLDRKKGGRDD